MAQIAAPNPYPGSAKGQNIAIIIIVGLLLFPFLYFFLGKKQGVKAGISKLIHEKGNSMIGFIVSKFTDKMANDPKWNESVKQNGIVKTVRNVFPGFIRTLNGLPWLLKRPLKIVFEAIDFATAIEVAHAGWLSMYDAEIVSPFVPQMPAIQIPMLLVNPAFVSFGV